MSIKFKSSGNIKPLSSGHPRSIDCNAINSRAVKQTALHLEPIAIDVEYSHIQFPDGSLTSVAAQVCCISPYASSPLLKSYCRHPILDPIESSSGSGSVPMRSCGGVRLSELHGAPCLKDVAAEGKLRHDLELNHQVL